jgi:hypothetical protein
VRIVLGMALFNGLFLISAILTKPDWGAVTAEPPRASSAYTAVA